MDDGHRCAERCHACGLRCLRVTLGLALFIQFSKKVRPGAIVVYSLVEGFVLGALSCAFEMMYPGIVVSAVLATSW